MSADTVRRKEHGYFAGSEPLYSDPAIMRVNIQNYIDGCAKANPPEPVCITGLALYLGFCDRQSLYDYQKRPAFESTIKWGRTLVENSYEKRLDNGYPTGAIFALKQMGWSDRQDINMTGSVDLSSRLDDARKRAGV